MPSITRIATNEDSHEDSAQPPHQVFGAEAHTFDQGITTIAHERGPDLLLSKELPEILRQLVELDGLEATAKRLAKHWSLDPENVQGNIAKFLAENPGQ